jgi:hypothetical protein
MGSITRGVGKRVVDSEEEFGTVGAMISAPVENILFDIFVHRDIPITRAPRVEVVSGLVSVARPVESDLLPLPERPHEIGGRPPVVDTPLLPRYATIVEHVHKLLRFEASEFQGYRYHLRYPPFPSTVRYCIPHQPRSDTTQPKE